MQKDITVIKIYDEFMGRMNFKVVQDYGGKLYYRDERGKLKFVFKNEEGITFSYVRSKKV